MPFPTTEQIVEATLDLFSDKKERGLDDVSSFVHKKFNMTDIESNQLLPSGRESRVDNRTRWALFRLQKARLLESQKRGKYQITDDGLIVVKRGDVSEVVSTMLRLMDPKERDNMNRNDIDQNLILIGIYSCLYISEQSVAMG